jgi:hypothetical protein
VNNPANLIPIPTQAATSVLAYTPSEPDAGATLDPLASPGPALSPTPLLTIPAGVDLPNPDGLTVSCPSNTLSVAMNLNGSPPLAISRIEGTDAALFFIADGGLYALPRQNADAGDASLTPVLTPGMGAASRPVQELTDLALSLSGSLLYTLDKAGSVYRIIVPTQEATLFYRPDPDHDIEFDPQMMALTVDESGEVLLLDSSNGFIWRVADLNTLERVGASRGLTSGMDLAISGEAIYALRDDGATLIVNRGLGSSSWRDGRGIALALGLKTSRHLGIDMLLLVDAMRREVTGFLPGERDPITRHAFAFPEMGMLRDAVYTGGRLYAIADSTLYVYPGDTGDEAPCLPLDRAAFARPTLYGLDLIGLATGLRYPIREARLPAYHRLYPGAGRLYRLGVHQGLDIYSLDSPEGFGIGWPALAAGAGDVTYSSTGYVPMGDGEFNTLVATAEAVGFTPPEALDRFSGRMVVIDHGARLETAYLHLDEIAPGAFQNGRIQTGQPVGTVGVTGTDAEVRSGTVGAHLHFEVYVTGKYLGYGITIRETMWWLAAIFPDAAR